MHALKLQVLSAVLGCFDRAAGQQRRHNGPSSMRRPSRSSFSRSRPPNSNWRQPARSCCRRNRRCKPRPAMRGMEQLLSGTVRNYLPPDWQQVTAALQGSSSYGALSADVQNRHRHATQCCRRSVWQPCRRAGSSSFKANGSGAPCSRRSPTQALANASNRFAAIQIADRGDFGATTDQKGILDLQARINAELGMLQNEQTKAQLLNQSALAQVSSLRAASPGASARWPRSLRSALSTGSLTDQAAAGVTALMGFFATFWSWLNGQLAAYIGDNTARLAGVLEPAVVTLATIYVMAWGYLHLTGKINEPIRSWTQTDRADRTRPWGGLEAVALQHSDRRHVL